MQGESAAGAEKGQVLGLLIPISSPPPTGKTLALRSTQYTCSCLAKTGIPQLRRTSTFFKKDKAPVDMRWASTFFLRRMGFGLRPSAFFKKGKALVDRPS